MKRLFIIRHAKSSWSNPSLPDHKRPLNKRGLRDAPFMAKVLEKTGVSPDLILSSPAKRAYTTACYFAAALGIPEKDIRKESRIYDSFPSDMVDIIQELPSEIETILVFGHNPTFTSFANKYADKHIFNMPTCSIAHVEGNVENWKDFSPGTANLVAFHYPKQYFTK
jgi:phosphohistidine phosphatase